jgi:hypothetical protein
MPHDHHSPSTTTCPSCGDQPFTRNAYWTGKLMLVRDFVDEQQYVIEKLRHHNQHLHGTGVVCGLKVVPHENEECRKDFVCVEPGSAIDCCGRDIVLRERTCIDLRKLPELAKLLDEPGERQRRVLRVCIRYRECPTEDVPVLYDECGCDDARCAPNRILESYELVVELLDRPPERPATEEGHCCEKWKDLPCPSCDHPDCVVLAVIDPWLPGAPINANAIDNVTFRRVLPSVQAIKEFLDCLKLCEPGGGGQPGEGRPGTNGTNGTNGRDGTDGRDGEPGPGLEAGLTQIRALSWPHQVPAALGQLAKIDMGPEQPSQLGLVIAFTGRVQAKGVDAAHVFQVLALHKQEERGPLPFVCRCPLAGKVIPVEVTGMSGSTISDAKLTANPTPDALAFIFDAGDREMPPEPVVTTLQRERQELWVVLRCDFVIDEHGRAVDGEHVRGQLLSGDRPAPPDPASKFGIQGGLFESWFQLGRG